MSAPFLTGVAVNKWFPRGALVAVIGTFPLAALCAAVYKFPIPMSGMHSGVSAVPKAMFAVVFYGLFGGFVVQAVLGGIGGVVAAKVTNQVAPAVNRLCVVFALAGAALGILALVFLDKVIGPW
jgi:hypothetical protein